MLGGWNIVGFFWWGEDNGGEISRSQRLFNFFSTVARWRRVWNGSWLFEERNVVFFAQDSCFSSSWNQWAWNPGEFLAFRTSCLAIKQWKVIINYPRYLTILGSMFKLIVVRINPLNIYLRICKCWGTIKLKIVRCRNKLIVCSFASILASN